MGNLDTNGDVNFYAEDTTFKFVSQCPDVDDHGRYVARHCVMDATFGLTHGFTSTWGGRHIEYYDCDFIVDESITNGGFGRNFVRFIWVRAGTTLIKDSFVDNPNVGYGASDLLSIGDNTAPSGSYLIDRQPGCGHNGSAYVSDPMYIYNNTGDGAYDWGFNEDENWDSVVQEGRDIFVNAGAKSGYSEYTYPHPLRSVIEG
jgi:hypothetical protein